MTRELVVWVEGLRAGRVAVEQGLWRFSYDPGWLSLPRHYALSPHLPLRAGRFSDTADKKTVEWFFENLLPEGPIRDNLARAAKLAPADLFGLLARFGQESAGALTLLSEGEAFPSSDQYEPLSAADLEQMLDQIESVPLIAAQGRARTSLAGAQHKLPLHRRGEVLLRPAGAPSSVIVKPDSIRADLFPFTTCNEHFCMTLARRVGLPAPRTEILRLLPRPLYLVERYDRWFKYDRVNRLHQVDLCQMLSKWAGCKYEQDGGATLLEAFTALGRTRQPAVARKMFLRWLVFNYVIGNSDAHAKNISFLVGPWGIELAPAYDLLCVKAYGEDHDYMAMTIHDQVRYGWVEWPHWKGLAEAVGVKPSLVRALLAEFANVVPAAVQPVLDAEPFTYAERNFLRSVVDVINAHGGYLREASQKL